MASILKIGYATRSNSIGQVFTYGPATARRTLIQSGVNTPAYGSKSRKKQRYGNLPINYVSIRHTKEFVGSEMGYSWRQGSITYTVTGNSLPIHGSYSSYLSRFGWPSSSGWFGQKLNINAEWDFCEKLVRNKLRDKIQNMKVNLAQAMGERKQTARLLEDTANRVIRSVRSLRKGDIRSFCKEWGVPVKKRHQRWDSKKISKKWANLWLEYHYGWKPFFSDVYGSAETLADQALEREGILRTRVRTIQTVSLNDVISNIAVDYPPRPGSTRTLTLDGKIQGRGYAYFTTERLMPTLGVGNPALLAWELLPFSFVADWFFGVGNFLQGINAMDGVTVVRSGLSRTLKMEVIDSCPWGTDTGLHEEFERRTLSLEGTFSDFVNENRFNLTKFVTTLALMRQVFSKGTTIK